ncbi:mechanosensitive ion channel family protein [Variovorax sp. HJSM1_2]|uniref:mechanosensitive ion channel family protein n=1 Tax=Variovorax sp. HJSM1_2 TaxID=3366263 RepID=UPI003BDB0AA8
MLIENLLNFLRDTTFLNNSLQQWGVALASALLAYGLMTFALRLVRERLALRSGGTSSVDALSPVSVDVSEADQTSYAAARHAGSAIRPILAQTLDATRHWLLVAGAVLIGLHLLVLPERWEGRVSQLWFVTVALQLALWGARMIQLWVQFYMLKQAGLHRLPSASEPAPATVSATLIGWALQTAMWAVVALAVMSNLGFNITAFVASLGIGGIAVALAAQNILGDLFASVSIALDKPFEVGDAVATGSVAGTVEHVGLKTTRLRSASGEQIVVSNTGLLKDSLKNYKRMSTRRIEFSFGVTYNTTTHQAAEIPKVVQRILQAQPQVKFDRAHFTSFGESALNYVVVYVMQTADYGVYMDTQQAVNLALMEALADMGVEFAYPTRTVVLQPRSGETARPARASHALEAA